MSETMERKLRDKGLGKRALSNVEYKDYCKILNFFDDTEWDDMNEVQELVESRAYDSVDEYGVPCDFNPSYEYSQIAFYDYTDDPR